jgi:hypothetical protein
MVYVQAGDVSSQLLVSDTTLLINLLSESIKFWLNKHLIRLFINERFAGRTRLCISKQRITIAIGLLKTYDGCVISRTLRDNLLLDSILIATQLSNE